MSSQDDKKWARWGRITRHRFDDYDNCHIILLAKPSLERRDTARQRNGREAGWSADSMSIAPFAGIRVVVRDFDRWEARETDKQRSPTDSKGI